MRFRNPIKKRREQRVEAIRQIRFEKRYAMPGFYDYGDIEFNKRRAMELRQQAQEEDG